MRKLIEQILKFGVVGVIAALLDFGILNLLVIFLHMHNVIASTISFTLSFIFNYLASMKYVFKHRPDMARWMEVLIFLLSAVIGLMMNNGIIWLSTYGMNRDAFITQHVEYVLRTNVGKIIATFIVAVWNFVIRKIFLDDTHTAMMAKLQRKGNIYTEEELEAKWERSLAHRIGMWSIEHTPKGWH
ncbi:GtrA family protein [Bifidobacterium gallicum]|uniref:GtrA-like protein n=1 Tax=Bifidobacterium gallicum DSM 20093 = LMG 11596 TaxID=561180 RepID=D1NUJ2_9BIFI|nr:GtrA family protein [Bifidobacterium gallicum]EFA23396.1 GtrA-like protein [Bifidobacterium gallicum DSM 20093 = LMG 11596]